MKFGKTLERLSDPKFQGYYIRYKELKKVIKVWTGDEKNQSTVQEVTHWTSSFLRLGPNPATTTEKRLLQVLTHELDRLSKFAELQADALRSQVGILEHDSQKSEVSHDELWRRLDDLGDQVVELKAYAELNFTGFLKILKKFDKSCQTTVKPWFMADVARAPLMGVDYDSLILSLARIAAYLREAKQSSESEAEKEQASPSTTNPGGAQREFVFWVDPKDSLWLKVKLAMHLNIMPARVMQDVTGQKPSASSQQKAVFFDTANLSFYRAYVGSEQSCETEGVCRSGICNSSHLRIEGDSIRLVHEGITKRQAFSACQNAPFEQPPVERQRVEVPLSKAGAESLIAGEEVEPLLSAVAPGIPVQPLTEVLKVVRDEIKDAGLRPMAGASYVRTVFNTPLATGTTAMAGAIAVLDEDVRIGSIAAAKDWGSSSEDDRYFPKDVLTLSLPLDAGSEGVPLWLRKILGFAEIHQVAGFSKGAHAIARSHARSCQLPMPQWHDHILESEVHDARTDNDEQVESTPRGSGNEETTLTVPDKLPKAKHLFSPQSTPMRLERKITPQHPGERWLHEFGGPRSTDSQGMEFVGEEEAFRVPARPGGGLQEPLLASDGLDEISEGESQGLVARFRKKGHEVWSAMFGLSTNKPYRKAIVSVQPKTYFGNERTFLEWIHLSVNFAVIGLIALHATDNSFRSMGRCMVIIAIFLIAWALKTFTWRSDALDKKEITDYEDAIGPFVVIASLLLALIWAAAVAVLQPRNELMNGGATVA